MKLKEYLDFIQEDCIDTYDDKFDAAVTVNRVNDEWEDDGYTRFNKFINENVEVLRGNSDSPICGWSKFIEDNEKGLKKYMEEQWGEDCQYDDPDDFQYVWIKQIHLYLSGALAHSEYDELLSYLTNDNGLNKLAGKQKTIENESISFDNDIDNKISRLFAKAAAEYKIDPQISKQIIDNVLEALRKQKEKGEVK